MIIIQIQGGFGNQLFQYAYGIHLRKKYNLEVIFNISFFSNQELFKVNGNSFRNFDLFELLKYDKSNSSRNNSEFIVMKYYFSIFNRILKRFNYFFYNWKLFHFNKDENKDIEHLLLKPGLNIVLEGYWQDISFLSEEFTFKIRSLLNKVTFPIVNPKLDFNNSVSIHIRRDDYINHKTFIVLSNIYYEKAVRLIESKVSNPFFYIFSDDKFSINDFDQFALLFPKNNFQIIRANNAIEDFCLMYKCNHNIIANSTFSWWASILNKNIDKIIISPLEWTNSLNSNQEINLKLLSNHIIIN